MSLHDKKTTPCMAVLKALPQKGESRKRVRRLPGGGASCKVLRDGVAVPCLRILDVAGTGASLQVAVPVPIGQTIQVALCSHVVPGAYLATLRVVRCAVHSRCGFVVGGQFSEPLAADAWRLLLS
jgi:hypothetical protein